MISTSCGVVESEAFNAPRAPRRPEAHSMAERPHPYAARPAPASPSRARSTLGVLTNVIAPPIFIAFKTTLIEVSKVCGDATRACTHQVRQCQDRQVPTQACSIEQRRRAWRNPSGPPWPAPSCRQLTWPLNVEALVNSTD